MKTLDLVLWADSRETSLEIARAIHKLSSKGAGTMDDLWCNPTTYQLEEIVGLAWSYAPDDETHLYWGCYSIGRE